MQTNRPVSPAEFAVRFGLEPVDLERLMRSYCRGMSHEKLRREIQALGCTGDGGAEGLSRSQASQRNKEPLESLRPVSTSLAWH